ncbi:YbaB/EbfC family nucleoid-associated protein [Rhodococcus fascians]|nr:YbaB/EbfC family nucleoid-associated protein [Rhodococcus fascians]
MTKSNSAFEELGAKVQRAQSVVREIRGVGTAGGIAVEVDAENRLIALHHPDSDIIMAAYQAALRDKQPQLEDAMRDVTSDPDAKAIASFVDTYASRTDAEPAKPAQTPRDDMYFQTIRQDPLGRNR